MALAKRHREAKRAQQAAPQRTVLRALARPWFRGAGGTTRRGDQIVLSGARAERYEPMLETGVGLELARIKTPDDAVAFVNRFGLLQGPRAFDWEPCPPETSEPFADFEAAASDLRGILSTVLDVRNAVNGDKAAGERIRQRFWPMAGDAELVSLTASGPVSRKAKDVLPPDRLGENATERSVHITATNWACMGLMNGMNEAHPYVFDQAQLFPDGEPAPGEIKVGVLPETLRGFCYLSVAQALAKEPVARCLECLGFFVVEDARQKFCTPRCAGRFRFKKHKNSPTYRKRIATQKSKHHDKTTRTR